MGRSGQGGGASAPRNVDFERGHQGRCGQGRRGLFSTTALVTRRAVLALALSAVLWPQDAGANPDGGTVVGGAAAIVQTSPNRLDIMQATDRVIIDWRSFSIGEAEHTNYAQPSTNSVALNRVIGGDLSTIAGRLSANGNIVLINPNGVIFTSTARVDVHGLIASTSNIGNDDFMAGRLDFSAAADPSSFVINRGEITATEGGLVALVAPWVENSGVIAARMGRVELASGGAFTVDLYGDGLIQLALAETGEVPGELSSGAQVSNLGLIGADGGVVALTVADARNLVDSVINMEGIIEARTVEQSAGRIVLNGGDTGIVRVSGTLDASGRDAGEIGGQVAVLGHTVSLDDGALVDVSGDAGGGMALIGGNYQGLGPEPNAQFTYLSSGMKIDADAITQGDGGTVIVWADQSTSFGGTITARGGVESGDGGFVETSGKQSIDFAEGSSVDAGAADGAAGQWLIDPTDIIIDGATAKIISAALTGGTDVDVLTQAAGSDDGDITVSGGIVSFGAGNLTLTAHDDVIFRALFDGDPALIDFSEATGTLDLLADGVSSDGIGAIVNDSPSPFAISMGSGGLTLVAGSGIGTSASPITLAEDGTIRAKTTDSGGIFLEFDFNNDVFIGAVVSAGDVSIVNLEGSITISDDIVAAGAVTINATIGDVTATADIFAGGNAGFIDVDGDDVTLAGIDTRGVADAGIADSGDVDIDGRSITVNSTIFTGGGDGDVLLSALGAISLAGIDTTAAGTNPGSGFVDITAGRGSIDVSGNIVTGGTDGSLEASALSGILVHDVTTVGSQTYTSIGFDGNGTVTFASTYTTGGGDFTVNADLFISDDASIATSGGNITFNGTVNGIPGDDGPDINPDLTLDAGTGAIVFAFDVGAVAALTDLSATGATIDLNDVTTLGNQTYTGAVTYEDTFITNGGNFTANGTAIFDTGFAVTTGVGDFTVNGPATLFDDLSIATAGGDIAFNGTVNGYSGAEGGEFNPDLTLDADTGAIALRGDVGALVSLTSFEATGATVTLGGSSYAVDAGFTVFGDTLLENGVSILNDGGVISFFGAIDGPRDLVLDAGFGTVALRAVGGTTALTGLDVTAGTIFLRDVSTTGAQTYTSLGGSFFEVTFSSDYVTDGGDFTVNGATTLFSDSSVTTAGGNITFNGTIDGTSGEVGPIIPDLTLSADAGAIALNDAVGTTFALGDLTATGATIDLSDVTTIGNQTYTGVVIYENIFLTNGGNFTANGTASFDTGFAVTTSGGNFTVGGPATLLDDLSVATTGGGNITFAGTIDGGHDLVLDAGVGAVGLLGAVGSATALTGVSATGATVNLTDVATTGDQTYSGGAGGVSFASTYTTGGGAFIVNGATTLFSDTSVATSGGNITFNGTIDGAPGELGPINPDLTLSADAGAIALLGNVGGKIPLADLTATGATIDLSDVTTLNDQTYTGAVTYENTFLLTNSGNFTANGTASFDTGFAVTTFGGDFTVNGDTTLLSNTTVTTGAGGGNITFASTIDFAGTIDGAFDLELVAGTGAIDLQGNVGAADALASLSAAGATIDLNDVTTAGAQTYSGAVTFASTYTTGGGDFTVTGDTTLRSDTTVTTGAGGGNITFAGTIDTDIESLSPSSLTLVAGTGAIALQGDVGAAIALASLSAAGATIDLNDVTTAGAQTYSGAVTFASTYTTGGGAFIVNGATTLFSNTSVATSGGNITFNGTIDGAPGELGPINPDLTLSADAGAIALLGNVGGKIPLANLTATGATIDLSDVTTLNDQTYTGVVTYENTFLLTEGGNFTANGTASFDTGFAVTTFGGNFTVGGPATLLDNQSIATAGGDITFAGTIDGAFGLALDAVAGTVALQGDVGAAIALTSLSAAGATIDLNDVTTAGAQTYSGAVTFASTYTTRGGNFTVIGATRLSSDTTIATAGGDITFNGTVNGELTDFAEDLTLSSGSGAVRFNGLVGNSVALGVVDARLSSSLTASGNLLVNDFLRVVDDPLPSSFDVLLLLPEFVLPTEPNVIIPPNVLGGPSIASGNPARPVDISPVPNSLLSFLTLAALGEIAPGAGTEGGESVVVSEVDAEIAAEALELILETCPDVVLTSLAWQNTPADAAFNRNPMMLPYSVDEYCAGYTLTIPGRGSAETYQGLTFVRRDFWTDLKQSRNEQVISEIRGDFGLPEAGGD